MAVRKVINLFSIAKRREYGLRHRARSASGFVLLAGFAMIAYGQPQTPPPEPAAPPENAPPNPQVQPPVAQPAIQLPVQNAIQVNPLRPGGAVRIMRSTNNGRFDASMMLIETSAPIANLLARADEGISREDWKFAIDSLQRVMQDEEGSVVPCDDGATPGGARFESARRLAQRKIASLPPEGLAAYRLLFDGSTKAMLDRAKSQHDAALLRKISEDYPATTWAPQTADLLGSWLIDEGRAEDAAGVLSDAMETLDADSPLRAGMVAKLAVARTMSGGRVSSEEIAEAAPKRVGTEKWNRGIEQIRGWSNISTDASNGDRSALLRLTVQSEVAPTIADRPAAEHPLRGSLADLWRRLQDNQPSDPLFLPVTQLTYDGDRLFTRTATGCAALDADDLNVLWETSLASPARVKRRVGRMQARQLSLHQQAEPLGMDEFLSALLSTGFGMVYVVDSNDADSEVRIAPSGTRIIALDAATGAVRWTRGGTMNASDELADVQFRSAPIPVRNTLWVPFSRQGDFSIAILNPTDGSLIRSRLVGSSGMPRNLAAAPPILLSTSESTVYVPSGNGALFALSAEDGVVRWVAQYPRTAGGNVNSNGPSSWLPSPAIPAGDSVILAPSDGRQLFAYSQTDGAYRWMATLENETYLLAAHADEVWVGGRTITCLSRSDGHQVWATRLTGVPTGRGVLSGSSLHLPTSIGLITLDAETGAEQKHQVQPLSQPPMGNLLCMDSALYSADSASIRKFLDVDRAYGVASSAHLAHPEDAIATLRLARVELARGNELEALTLLDGLTQEEKYAGVSQRVDSRGPQHETIVDPRFLALLANTRVAAALTLAANPKTPPREAIRRLEEVARLHATAAQEIEARLRIAELDVTIGDTAAAFDALIDLGTDPLAETVIPSADRVEARAREIVASRLREMTSLQDFTSSTRFLQHREWLGGLSNRIRGVALKADEIERLEALEQLRVPGQLSDKAAMILASDDICARRYERAELRMHEIMASAQDPAVFQSALVQLCAMYDESAENVPGLLSSALTQLERRFGDSPLTPEMMAAISSNDTGAKSVRDWVAARRARLAASASPSRKNRPPASPPDGFDTDRSKADVLLSSDTAWTHGVVDPMAATSNLNVRNGGSVQPNDGTAFRLIALDGEWAGTMVNRVVGFDSVTRLTCLEPATGNVVWQSELRLPEDFRFASSRESPGPPRFAPTDGQVAVFNSGEGLYAVGLVTGRLLWIRPYEIAYDENTMIYGDRAMAARDGLLAATPRDGRLTLMRMLDGSTVWECNLRGELLFSLSMDDSRIVSQDPTGQRIHVFDRSNGALVVQFALRQPDPGHETISIVHAEGRLFAPDASAEGDAVAAFDLSDGHSLWRVPVDHPIASLFEPGKGYLGVGLLGGDIRILDMRSGDVILEKSVSGARNVLDARLIDGTLVALFAIQKGDRRSFNLIAFDVPTGDEVWHKSDVTVNPPVLAVYGGLIPVISETQRADINTQGVAQPRTQTVISLVDIHTGMTAGNMVDIPGTNGGRPTGEIALYPDALLVGTTKGLTAFKTTSTGRH
ncbi:MAG: PQQ-binding-like beta-propeller repeat protein [Planctomycetes bacterium]|nr:PQQ-binding-like beta-propeller repeat protein [Planctomycetota bacterium]MBI3833076.1 PQQ-binding-like beta-propeller repeat protein [Planctomycetota bacterium]